VALRAHELGLRPTIVTKRRLEESNTRYAQGGIAAAIGPDDSVDRHRRDTIRAGAGLVDGAAARVLTSEAPRRIADLVRYGVPFDTVEGRIALGREAAHTRHRILHAGGDATGLRIEETLRARVLEQGIDARERTRLRALRPALSSVTAILSRADGSAVEEVPDRPVVLASGGAASLYRQSSNPPIATGEGVAIAFRAGALVSDMEFLQFHPTAFAREGAQRFLITEALRGEGAVLRTVGGRRFMPRYHPLAELAPRDVVSRAIVRELKRSGHRHVLLDATSIPAELLYSRFPSICHFLRQYGLDPARDPIPISPVAHYLIGGVATDLEGRTSIPGLWACGEVACTGVHGANRLASNSLLEGIVFGARVAQQLRHPVAGGPSPPDRCQRIPALSGEGRSGRTATFVEIGRHLWDSVGIVREGGSLVRVERRLLGMVARHEPSDPSDLPNVAANAALTAFLMARAARAREESRGTHYRTDFPSPRPRWRHHQGLLQVPSEPGGRTVKRRRP
jgi:L-aspartate oxidase